MNWTFCPYPQNTLQRAHTYTNKHTHRRISPNSFAARLACQREVSGSYKGSLWAPCTCSLPQTRDCWTACLCINSFGWTLPCICKVRLQSNQIHLFSIDFCSGCFFFFVFFFPKNGNFYEYKCDALHSLWPMSWVLPPSFSAKRLFWKISLYRYFVACQEQDNSIFFFLLVALSRDHMLTWSSF